MTDYNGLYNKLTKKELLYTLIARDAMLKDCRERFELHKNTDAKTIQDQSDLIEELKAKLAVNKKWLASNEGFLENQKLKQQLTEKAKELAYMTKQAKKFNNEAQKYFEDAYCNDTTHQDKISFTLEQLEKVKEYYTTPIYDRENPHTEVRVLLQRIDNQIKQLKEMK